MQLAAGAPWRGKRARSVPSWRNPSLRATAALAAFSGSQWSSMRSRRSTSKPTRTSAPAASLA
jgi:hypothetical protein